MAGSAFPGGDVEFALRLSTLLDAVRGMHEARNSTGVREILGQHVLAVIKELVPAHTGAILLADQMGSAGREKELFDRVASERGPIVDTSDGRVIAAIPLMVHEEPAGMIYLEHHADAEAFGDHHWLILTAITRMASVALENAFHLQWLKSEIQRLESCRHENSEMAGESEKLKELSAKVARVAPRDTTVLIFGESGTGKELVARSLHRQSPRAGNPFVAINCAALTESLLESELFGHERGAFTGAIAQKQGRLESAEGGTVFLDEIGEMSISLQAKLLRVLQHREFQRVGGTRTIPLDVRLIAATNRNLEQAVFRGAFRGDLFYRLNVITLRTPSLRERPEDIVPLAHHFAVRFSQKCGRRITGISPKARSALRSYDWPGNVRELENAIEHAVVLGCTEAILAEDLPDVVRERWAEVSPRETGMLQHAINSAKRSAVKRAFELARNDHAEAAHLLGVHPNYLYRLLQNLDLQPMLKAMARE